MNNIQVGKWYYTRTPYNYYIEKIINIEDNMVTFDLYYEDEVLQETFHISHYDILFLNMIPTDIVFIEIPEHLALLWMAYD